MRITDTGEDRNFVGTLAHRVYKSGDKFIQLWFEDALGDKLVLTRNARMAKELHTGEIYRVDGPLYSTGRQTFLLEPKVSTIKVMNKAAIFWVVSGSLALLVLIPGSVFAMKHYKSSSSGQNANQPAQKEEVKGNSKVHPLLNYGSMAEDNDQTNQTDENKPPEQTTQTAPSQTTPTTRRTTNTSTTQNASPVSPAASAPVQPPPPDPAPTPPPPDPTPPPPDPPAPADPPAPPEGDEPTAP